MILQDTLKVIKVTATRNNSGGLMTKIQLPDDGPRFIDYNYSLRNHMQNALLYLFERPALYTIVGTTDNNEIIVI